MTWDPSSVAGKALWLRAKDVTGANGAAATSWPDQSGRSVTVTPAGTTPTIATAATPSGGRAVTFGGNGQYNLSSLPQGPTVVSATAKAYYTGETPDNAFNGDGATTFWTDPTNAGNTWLQVQYATAYTPTGYSITTRAGQNQRDPKDWTFQGSNDGAAWTTLDTQSGQTFTSGGTNTYSFTNSTAYAYYKLNISAVANPTASNPGTQVAELALTGDPTIPSRFASGAEAWVVTKSSEASGTWRSLWALGADAGISDQAQYPGQDGLIYESAFVGTGQRIGGTTPPAPVTSWRLYRVQLTASGGYTNWLDNTQIQTATGKSFGSPGAYRLGRGRSLGGDNSYFNGQVAELLIFAGNASSGDVANLIAYFNSEHGLTVPGGNVPPGATLAASSTLTAAGIVTKAGAATLAAVSLLTGTPTLAQQASVTMAASSTLSGTTGAVLPAVVTLAATSTLTANATVATPVSAAVTLAATSALTADAATGGTASVTMAATSTLSAHLPTSIAAAVQMDAWSDLTATVDQRAKAWTADQSGQSRVKIDLLPAVGVVIYPPAPAPATVTERALVRASHQLPALAPGEVADGTHPIVGGTVGVPHVWVGGKDITYFRGVPTTIGAHHLELPGGPTDLAVGFPQVSPFEARTGDLAWLQPNAPVEVALVADGSRVVEQWAGRLVKQQVGHSQTAGTCTWTAAGDLVDDAQSEQHQPPLIQDPEDIGKVVARVLTSKVPSRRYGPVKAVTTGILTSQRGSSDDYAWDYIQALLSTAWTADGKQWTVKPGSHLRQPVIALKDSSARTWTITVGAPGVECDISRDESQYVNVIYGRGIGPDGYAWEGRCYPNLRADDAPPFPYDAVGHLILVGTTDADTDTGHGVSDFQQQVKDLGYPIAVTGTYTADQVGIVERAQAAAGISVDGQVGPQTWAALFAVGSNAGNLNASYRRPLAIDPRVDPNLYAANGAITGPNPVYDRSIPRRTRSIDYGDNTTKAYATKDAQNQIQREMTAGWAGTITLQTDPWEGSRAYVMPGDKITILGWLGMTSLTLQVVSLTRDPSSAYKVTLTVDTLGRDAMTLDSIRKRNIDAKSNLALRPGNTEKSTKTTVVPFDGESGQAGIIPKLQLNGGYWTVIHIPISIGGQIAFVDVRTSAPAAPFVIATFASPVTASQLKGLGLGNPLASNTDNLWQTKADDLLDLGWIETWGSASQPCGYYPGQSSDGATLTGREFDTNPVSFTSNRGGYVWVALYSSADCFIEGNIKPGPVQP